jgi:hypothetical protein
VLGFHDPLNERHLRRVLTRWVTHYNRGRPHSSLGPGIPDPPRELVTEQPGGHRIAPGHRVVATRFWVGSITSIVSKPTQHE